jgi:hypothetical protein
MVTLYDVRTSASEKLQAEKMSMPVQLKKQLKLSKLFVSPALKSLVRMAFCFTIGRHFLAQEAPTPEKLYTVHTCIEP